MAVGRIGKGGRARRRTTIAAPVSSGNLKFSDFTYLGCFALPKTGFRGSANGGFTFFNDWGRITGRRVGEQTRIFLEGKGAGDLRGGIVEMVPPSTLAATPVIAGTGTGVRATVHRDWGQDVYPSDPNLFRQNNGTPIDQHGSILFHEGKLLWQFMQSYNVAPAQKDRFMGMTVLDDTTGTCTPYGPFRYGDPGVKYLGGYMASIPSDFAALYTGGRTLALGRSFNSGGSDAPWGIACFPANAPTTSMPPSSQSNVADVIDTPTQLICYTINNRQPTSEVENLQRRMCAYADPGNCSTTTAPVSAGATSIPVADTSLYANADSAIGTHPSYFNAYVGPATAGILVNYQGRSTASGPGFLTGIPAANTNVADSSGTVWPVKAINTAIAQGVSITLGKYDNNRGGVQDNAANFLGPDDAGGHYSAAFYDYVNAPCWIRTTTGKSGVLYSASLCDSVAGADYGTDTVNHVRYTGNDTCPHGQFSRYYGSTGPTTTSVVQAAWLYSFDDFAKLAQAQMSPANLKAVDFTHWHAISAQIPSEPFHIQGSISSIYFDSATDRLYLCERFRDVYSFNASSPVPIIHVFQL